MNPKKKIKQNYDESRKLNEIMFGNAEKESEKS